MSTEIYFPQTKSKHKFINRKKIDELRYVGRHKQNTRATLANSISDEHGHNIDLKLTSFHSIEHSFKKELIQENLKYHRKVTSNKMLFSSFLF